MFAAQIDATLVLGGVILTASSVRVASRRWLARRLTRVVEPHSVPVGRRSLSSVSPCGLVPAVMSLPAALIVSRLLPRQSRALTSCRGAV